MKSWQNILRLFFKYNIDTLIVCEDNSYIGYIEKKTIESFLCLKENLEIPIKEGIKSLIKSLTKEKIERIKERIEKDINIRYPVINLELKVVDYLSIMSLKEKTSFDEEIDALHLKEAVLNIINILPIILFRYDYKKEEFKALNKVSADFYKKISYKNRLSRKKFLQYLKKTGFRIFLQEYKKRNKAYLIAYPDIVIKMLNSYFKLLDKKKINLKSIVEQTEYDLINLAILMSDENKSAASRLLNIKRQVLQYKKI